MLSKDRNYIVSGLERSGTSMMMQILEAGGIPVAYDKSRKPDESNPRGYYELAGGKIIDKLRKHEFPLDKYLGKFIKITTYGIQFLPGGKYTIIYMERDTREILESSDKMAGKEVPKTWTNEKKRMMYALEGLNRKIKHEMVDRMDIRFLLLNYNNILEWPRGNMEMIVDFLELPDDGIDSMVNVIDEGLYRSR